METKIISKIGRNWAASWQNQQNDCAPSEDSDQPGHPPSLTESSLSTKRKLWSLATHWAHSEDFDQTGQMPRLIWVFAGHTVILLVLSLGGSIKINQTPLRLQMGSSNLQGRMSPLDICGLKKLLFLTFRNLVETYGERLERSFSYYCWWNPRERSECERNT